jgi:RNA polymerase sigma-70 factor (ECF subfamily)
MKPINSNALSDHELFRHLGTENSLWAFDLLFERYWKKLYAAAYARLGSQQEAQDCVQEIFVNLWTKKRELNVPLSIQGYLYTAVKNKVFNQLHARQIRDRHHHLYVKEINGVYADFSGSLEEEELNVIVQSEIAGMPDQMRKIYQLSREENLSGAEIATMLNISHQTVRNQISTALKRIRGRLRDYQL